MAPHINWRNCTVAMTACHVYRHLMKNTKLGTISVCVCVRACVCVGKCWVLDGSTDDVSRASCASVHYFRFRDLLPDSRKDLREFVHNSLTDSSGKRTVSYLPPPSVPLWTCHCCVCPLPVSCRC